MAKPGPAAALAALLLLGCYAAWQSPQHPVEQLGHQQRTEHAQRQPEAAPAEEEQAKSFWQATVHDPISFFTAVLAGLTAALVIVSGYQIHFLRRADETARISADAAKQSADAATRTAESLARTERAILSVTIVSENFSHAFRGLALYDKSPPDTLSEVPIVCYSVANHGKTPAFIQSVESCLRLAGNTPPSLNHWRGSSIEGIDVLAVGGKTDTLEAMCSQITLKDYQRARRQHLRHWLDVQVVFDDVFGLKWEHTSRFSQLVGTNTFYPKGRHDQQVES